MSHRTSVAFYSLDRIENRYSFLWGSMVIELELYDHGWVYRSPKGKIWSFDDVFEALDWLDTKFLGMESERL